MAAGKPLYKGLIPQMQYLQSQRMFINSFKLIPILSFLRLLM